MMFFFHSAQICYLKIALKYFFNEFLWQMMMSRILFCIFFYFVCEKEKKWGIFISCMWEPIKINDCLIVQSFSVLTCDIKFWFDWNWGKFKVNRLKRIFFLKTGEKSFRKRLCLPSSPKFTTWNYLKVLYRVFQLKNVLEIKFLFVPAHQYLMSLIDIRNLSIFNENSMWIWRGKTMKIGKIGQTL